MNFGKSRPRRQSGNAMIYVLIALGLLAALTASMMSQDSTGGDDISKDQAEFQATQILGYAAAAQSVLDQMVTTGTDPGAIDFAMPSATSFNNAPYTNKIFHPQGGGLNYKPAVIPPFVVSTSGTPEGWYITRRNVEWTPTTAQDILIGAYNISTKVCEAINFRLTGSRTIPNLVSWSTRHLTTTANTIDFESAFCPECVGRPALCFASTASDFPTFYSILDAR